MMKEKNADKIAEKYWVGSFGDYPSKIYFSADEAFQDYPDYIDTFNALGEKLTSYMMIHETGDYTTDF